MSQRARTFWSKVGPLTALWALVAAGCASTGPVIVGTARPPISVGQVVVYSHPPSSFEPIADLTASAKSAFKPGGPQQIDVVVSRLKEQAAKLGANGVILEGFSDAETATLGTGADSTSYSRNSAVGVGVGGSFGIFKKTGRARAIYVPPGAVVPQPAPPTPPPPG
jgi:hypothetical protein